jgi:hypothetical protein
MLFETLGPRGRETTRHAPGHPARLSTSPLRGGRTRRSPEGEVGFGWGCASILRDNALAPTFNEESLSLTAAAGRAS